MSTLSPSGLKTVNTLASPGQALDDNLALINTRLGGDIIAPPVTGLTGGGATNLDGLVTAGVAVGLVVRIWNGTQLSFYRLTAGTTAESSPTVIRPDDYATTTNEKVWLLVSEQMNNLVARGALLAGVNSSPFPVDLRGAAGPAAGVNLVGLIGDTTALAAGVGGGLGFTGIVDAAGTALTFAAVASRKENAVASDRKAACVFYVRPNTGDLIEFARGESGGNLLLKVPTTGLTGGGATKLDGIATLLLSAGVVVQVWNGNNFVPYRLRGGTDAAASPVIIRPHDYATTTNEKVWELVGARAASVVNAGGMPLTTSYAQADFGSALSLSIPTAGTYLITYVLGFTVDPGFANELVYAKVTDAVSADIIAEHFTQCVSDAVGSRGTMITLSKVHTFAAAETIKAMVKELTGGTSSLNKITQTYVRLF